MIVFVKYQISIPKSAMDAVMYCQTGAAHLFLENIYTILTHQKLPESLEILTVDDLVAHYALPTTNSVIRQMCGSAQKSKIILETHGKLLRNNNLNGSNVPQLIKY